jgi:hypothetical protein
MALVCLLQSLKRKDFRPFGAFLSTILTHSSAIALPVSGN